VTYVHVQGGRGGDGVVSFERRRNKGIGPPDGGDGGDGGDVIFCAEEGKTSLFGVLPIANGGSGVNGAKNNRKGKRGFIFNVPVPVGTIVSEYTPTPDEKIDREDLDLDDIKISESGELSLIEKVQESPKNKNILEKKGETKFLADLDYNNSTVVAGKGGKGGRGNKTFVSGKNRSPQQLLFSELFH